MEIGLDKYIDYKVKTIQTIKKNNVKAGLSLVPTTNENVLKYILNDLDLVLIMSVVPGKGGQSFMPISLDKISYLDNYRKENNLSYEIEVDGGINEQTIATAAKAGADVFVSGNAIFSSPDRKGTIEKFKAIAEENFCK